MMDFLKELFEVETEKEVYKYLFTCVVMTLGFYTFTWILFVLNLIIDIY
jgi:hypothetical protein